MAAVKSPKGEIYLQMVIDCMSCGMNAMIK